MKMTKTQRKCKEGVQENSRPKKRKRKTPITQEETIEQRGNKQSGEQGFFFCTKRGGFQAPLLPVARVTIKYL